ncbi:DUF1566 domain-containing protein [Alphaproteobacteria bacterium]|nr:DUF1566 domain-containing protein [Alphaproteobacteria bacterium]MDC1022958.1 DUF1566 domain-containing protein [Alphaproteobacteria bacterium]
MSGIKILSNRVNVIFIIFLICLNYNNVWANNFISRGHYVIDLSQKIEWLTCPVGMIWENKTCVGEALKLKFDKVDQVILQANKQLEGNWRLPTRQELEQLVCQKCKKVKIISKFFPNTPPESFWTSEINQWQPKFMWTVNFFTGYTFGRFPGFIPNYIRLVRDR